MSLQVKEVTIKIEASNPVDLKVKEEAIGVIANLDADTLSKLKQLAQSDKAIDKLKSNWFMIKNLVM